MGTVAELTVQTGTAGLEDVFVVFSGGATLGGSLNQMLPYLIVVMGYTAVIFLLAIIVFRRK